MKIFNAVQSEIKKMQSLEKYKMKNSYFNDEKRQNESTFQTFLCSSSSSTTHYKCTIKECKIKQIKLIRNKD